MASLALKLPVAGRESVERKPDRGRVRLRGKGQVDRDAHGAIGVRESGSVADLSIVMDGGA